MKKNFMKENHGITLIAMIITIIVMLILAGVSLNAVIGENGILTQAISAAEATKLAQIKEDLEYMFLDYNINNDIDSISQFLTDKVDSGDIDEFKAYVIDGTTMMVVKKDDYYFYVEEVNGEYIATQMEENLDGATASYVIVTADSFDSSSGTMSFEVAEGEEQTVIFYDEINDTFNFEIKSGTVTIYVTQDMNLTNLGMSRSAVDISSGATLNLHISDGVTMTVDSGYAEEGEKATDWNAKGGAGGYAGVHVPEGATLNLYGSGTLIAYGGDASDGNGTYGTGDSNTGGGRRWSAQALE